MTDERPIVALAADDPGAAAFLAGVLAAALPGVRWRLGAGGAAARWFDAEGIDHESIDDLRTPSPRVAVAGTGEDPGAPAMRFLDAAAREGAVTVAVVDANIAVVARFGAGGRAALRWPDHLLVADAAAGDALRRAGAPPARVHVVGSAALDRLVAKHSPPPLEPPRRLLFIGEPPGGYAELRLERDERYRLDGWSRPRGRTETVLEEVILALEARAAAGAAAMQLVIRPHPKCPPAQFEPYRSRVHAIDRDGPSWRAIAASHAVVGLTSAALDEAVVLGRPTLSIVPVLEEGTWLRSAAQGVTPCASTRAELRAAIDALLDQAPTPSSAVVAERLQLGGGRRAAELLRRIAGGVAVDAPGVTT